MACSPQAYVELYVLTNRKALIETAELEQERSLHEIAEHGVDECLVLRITEQSIADPKRRLHGERYRLTDDATTDRRLNTAHIRGAAPRVRVIASS